jgi:hypothetical protein
VRQSGSAAPVETLTDGDPSTFWITDEQMPPESAAVTFDLGRARPVGSIRWVYAVGDLADGLRIEVSISRRAWTTVAEPADAEPGAWQEQTVGVEARYVRFTFENTRGVPQLGGLAEVEIRP